MNIRQQIRATLRKQERDQRRAQAGANLERLGDAVEKRKWREKRRALVLKRATSGRK